MYLSFAFVFSIYNLKSNVFLFAIMCDSNVGRFMRLADLHGIEWDGDKPSTKQNQMNLMGEIRREEIKKFHGSENETRQRRKENAKSLNRTHDG